MSVRFPLDRDPVINTRPSGSSASDCTSRDSPELIGRDRSNRHQPEHAARAAMIAEAHAPDAADVLDVADPLGRRAGAQRFVAPVGHQRQQQRNHVGRGVHRLGVQALKIAVDADRRTRVGREVERRCAARRGGSKQTLEAGERVAAARGWRRFETNRAARHRQHDTRRWRQTRCSRLFLFRTGARWQRGRWRLGRDWFRFGRRRSSDRGGFRHDW